MKLGILADIHEDVADLRIALERLRQEAVECFVVLGDLADMGRHLGETVALLADARAVGVWGNHDLGLCHEPTARMQALLAGPEFALLQTLRPRFELGDCLFSHGLPCWDPADPVVYYLGDVPETDGGRGDAFAASSCRITFVGHFHRWLAATPLDLLGWSGGEPLLLDAAQRYLIVVAAVCDGWCATYDSDSGLLVPWRLRDNARQSVWTGG